MSLAVIGYTGFVGGTLCKQTEVTHLYNSQNIEEICGCDFDTILCAGAPGAKWKANRDGAADLKSVDRLINSLRTAHTRRFVLISTIDVYPSPYGVNETSSVDMQMLEPYGRNRYCLELSVREMFPGATIVRLPGLFGPGLRKNFIYDLMNGNALHLTHCKSTFQFYNMNNLWADIRTAQNSRLSLINFATEPVRVAEVARRCFEVEFQNQTEKPPVHYDMRTQFASEFGCDGPYLYSAEYTLAEIRSFVRSACELTCQ